MITFIRFHGDGLEINLVTLFVVPGGLSTSNLHILQPLASSKLKTPDRGGMMCRSYVPTLSKVKVLPSGHINNAGSKFICGSAIFLVPDEGVVFPLRGLFPAIGPRLIGPAVGWYMRREKG